MQIKNHHLLAALVLLTFLTCWIVAHFFDRAYGSLLEAIVGYYTWYWLPPLLLLWLLFRGRVFEVWGLAKPPWKHLGVAFLMSLPALLGFAATQAPHWPSFNAFVLRVLLPGTMEELLYRGFLFGLLFTQACWGFVPAGLVAALVFGAGHLYQGHDLNSAFGAFAITALGGFWFAWLFLEWGALWLPMGLHVLLNAFWEIFTNDATALGDGNSNIWRGLVIALSVFWTLRIHKNRVVTRATLWRNTPTTR